MDKKNWTYIIIIVVLGAALFLFFKNPFAVTNVSMTQFALPRYGSAECVAGLDRSFTAWQYVPVNGVIITACPGTNCQIQVQSPAYSAIDPNAYGVFLNVCSGTICQRISDIPNFILHRIGTTAAPNVIPSNVPVTIGTFRAGQSAFLQYAVLNIFTNRYNTALGDKLQWRLEYTPVRLRMQNGLGQISYREGDCSLTGITQKVTDADPNDPVAKDPSKCTTNACEPGGYINWVDFWEKAEIFGGGLVTYNSQSYFCASGTTPKLWQIGEMYIDGNYLKYPSYATNIPIQCCPNQILGNKQCNSAFQWVDLTPSTISCFSDAVCPGQNTQWITDGTNTAKQNKYGCVSGKCGITATRNVECNEMLACSGGKVCKEGVCVTETPGFITPKEECEKYGNTWITEYNPNGSVKSEYCQKGTDYTTIIVVAVIVIILILTALIIWRFRK